MAAATPPSAMTVWALPRSDLQTSAVRSPRSFASMAARSPAPPAPMTITSYACVSWSLLDSLLPYRPPARTASDERPSEDLRVGERARRHQPHVKVGEGHHHEADPGELHVLCVQAAQEAPRLLSYRERREDFHVPPTHMPGCVAGEAVEPKEGGVGHQDEGSDAHPETTVSWEPESLDGIDRQDHVEERGDEEEVTVEVLKDQGEP